MDFRDLNQALDKYVIRWLKDYHVYYDLPHTFGEFVENNGLGEHYPKTMASDRFSLYRAVSKYDVWKSSFRTEETAGMIEACFLHVMETLEQSFAADGIRLNDALFSPSKKLTPWKPFKDALFYDWQKQPEKRILLSASEIYLCKKLSNGRNEWTFSANITSEAGRRFVGYVMKQTESVLRRLTGYKHKLSASLDMINEATRNGLVKNGLFVDKLVSSAVSEFHREANKTVVAVDHAALERIREEAKVTQEALIVEEETEYTAPEPEQAVAAKPASDVWGGLKSALNDYERIALEVLLQGGDLKAFADECGIMTEVLADGINEKAMDLIGDNLMDEDFMLYEDYIDEIKEWKE
jgi:hypothetical protein